MSTRFIRAITTYAISANSSRRRQGVLCASLGLGLALAVSITLGVQGFFAFADTCADIRTDTLRLHVVANSNSVADQTVKLQVRDAVLEVMEALYADALAAKNEEEMGVQANVQGNAEAVAQVGMQGNAEAVAQAMTEAEYVARLNDAQTSVTAPLTQAEAIALLRQNWPQLNLAVQQALAAAGVQQEVCIYFTEMYFDTTEYQDFTLPAGAYTALRVELGQASGQNWFCVLYPSLCIASASGEYAQPPKMR